jgi:hypothetical protein
MSSFKMFVQVYFPFAHWGICLFIINVWRSLYILRMSLLSIYKGLKPGMVAHAYNSCTWEAKTGGSRV